MSVIIFLLLKVIISAVYQKLIALLSCEHPERNAVKRIK